MCELLEVERATGGPMEYRFQDFYEGVISPSGLVLMLYNIGLIEKEFKQGKISGEQRRELIQKIELEIND